MLNVGGPEVMVILLVALIVLGPQQLPKAMRAVSGVMNELRKVSSGFQSEMQKVMDMGTTDTTGREVRTSDTTPQSSPGPGAGVIEGTASPTAGEGSASAEGTTDAPASGPAVIDPADRAAG